MNELILHDINWMNWYYIITVWWIHEIYFAADPCTVDVSALPSQYVITEAVPATLSKYTVLLFSFVSSIYSTLCHHDHSAEGNHSNKDFY